MPKKQAKIKDLTSFNTTNLENKIAKAGGIKNFLKNNADFTKSLKDTLYKIGAEALNNYNNTSTNTAEDKMEMQEGFKILETLCNEVMNQNLNEETPVIGEESFEQQ
jgi:hypothetical protein